MTSNQPRMMVTATGKVGIGTMDPLEALHVIGNFRVSGLIYSGAADIPVPDYVFEPDYKLMSIEALGRFLAEKKHLPNVPSAGEIKENGLNVSEFQMKLLEKIEELALYTVQQAKSLESKGAELVELKADNAALKTDNTLLKVENASLKMQNNAIEARLAIIEQILANAAQNGGSHPDR
jgi:hypothetical protein